MPKSAPATATLAIWAWHILDAGLDQGVAICAEKNALFSLSPHPRDTSTVTLAAEMELLFLGIEVVKLQSGRMLIKAAKATSTTGFIDQLTLDLAPPLRHGRRIAPRTAIATLPASVKHSLAVPRAHHVCLLQPHQPGRFGFSAPRSLGCL
jgi:hypothetical protein